MKLFAKLMMALLVLALLLPFTFLKDKDGNTMMSFSDLSLPDFSVPDVSGLSNSGESATGIAEKLGGKDLFYKWYDAEGNLQFTTTPPPEGIEYSVKGFDPNTNVIQAVKLPAEEPEAESSEPKAAKSDGEDGIPNPYSQEAIKKLFEDTRNIEKLLNDRVKQQNSAIN